jgi:hypothetical protein
MADPLDSFVKMSAPVVDLSQDRLDRLADTVMARIDTAAPACSVARGCQGSDFGFGLIVRYVLPMAAAAGLALVAGHGMVGAGAQPQPLSAMMLAQDAAHTLTGDR